MGAAVIGLPVGGTTGAAVGAGMQGVEIDHLYEEIVLGQ